MDFKDIDHIVEEADKYLGKQKHEFDKIISHISIPYEELLHFVEGKEPLSQAYTSGIIEMHRQIIKKDDRTTYSYMDEGMHEIDPCAEYHCDWPCASLSTTAEFLHDYADIIKVMNLSLEASVLIQIPSSTKGHGDIWVLDNRLGECSLVQKDCLLDKRARMLNKYRDFCAALLSNDKNIKVLQKSLRGNPFCIYGLGKVGRELVSRMESVALKGILDKFSDDLDFRGLPIYHPDTAPAEWREYDILVTPLTDCKEICQQLVQAGYRGRILDIYEIVQMGK